MSPSFPLTFGDLSLWLAFSTFILLILTEGISPYIGKTRIGINHKRLEKVALGVSLAFLATLVITIIRLVLGT